ncbi:hypothetical protein FPQ18DRAFT_339979 [Pyronema domesticum]|nr:hypothetical protein FPQ18DRAFT_339979 [Pyronema domesticum]
MIVIVVLFVCSSVGLFAVCSLALYFTLALTSFLSAPVYLSTVPVCPLRLHPVPGCCCCCCLPALSTWPPSTST